MTEPKGLTSFPSRVHSMPSLRETQMIFGHKQFSSLALQDYISYREGPWYEHQTICGKCYLGFQVRVHSKIYTPLYRFLDWYRYFSIFNQTSNNFYEIRCMLYVLHLRRMNGITNTLPTSAKYRFPVLNALTVSIFSILSSCVTAIHVIRWSRCEGALLPVRFLICSEWN